MNRMTTTLLALALSGAGANATAASLDIEADGFDGGGQAMLELYSSRVSFPEKPREQVSSAISAGKAHWHFDDLPPGDYAVRIWDDADSDGRLNRSMFGRAKEPFVFSNGIHDDEPDWDAVRFTIGGPPTNLQLSIAVSN